MCLPTVRRRGGCLCHTPFVTNHREAGTVSEQEIGASSPCLFEGAVMVWCWIFASKKKSKKEGVEFCMQASGR